MQYYLPIRESLKIQRRVPGAPLMGIDDPPLLPHPQIFFTKSKPSFPNPLIYILSYMFLKIFSGIFFENQYSKHMDRFQRRERRSHFRMITSGLFLWIIILHWCGWL